MTNVVSMGDRVVGDAFSISPDRVLQEAAGKLLSCVIVGMDEDGALYVASSEGRANAAFLMQRGIADLIQSLD
ncbi:hypothetical protein [Aureimonas sp. N4]|uniref:hypothetical protein n=1 Tax=Aureimonas sp. N4 TaxID=1638165 RepID=UPI0007818D9A|nr:hypothetical protein [Aureimonas sp. N4]